MFEIASTRIMHKLIGISYPITTKTAQKNDMQITAQTDNPSNELSNSDDELFKMLAEEAEKYKTPKYTKRRHGKNTGLDVIRTYNGDKYKDEICIIFQTGSGECKYKFAQGQQNSIDIVRNEEEISAEVTNGMLNKNFNITKNADGTYTINDEKYKNKTFCSIDEVACELNKYKLEPNYAEDGILDNVRQGLYSGDCGTLATIMGFGSTEAGREIIKNCIEYNNDGTVTVHFPGLDTSVTIPKISSTTTTGYGSMTDLNSSIGDAEYAYIEKGLIAALESNEIELSNDFPYWCTQLKTYATASPIKGRHPQFIMYALTGKEPETRASVGKDNKRIQEYLDEFEENKGNAIIVGAYRTPDGKSLKSLGSVTAKDAFGKSININTFHAYAIKDISRNSKGERIITIYNLKMTIEDGQEEYVMKEEDFLKTFSGFDTIQLNGNENCPKYYNKLNS